MNFAHLPVRDILRLIIYCASLRYFDRTRPFASPEIGRAARIAHFGPVHDQRVVVETGSHSWRREGPIPVGFLLHVRLGSAPEVDAHLSGIRSFDADLHARVGVNARILRIQTFDVAGLKSPECYAIQKCTPISTVIAIRLIIERDPPDKIMVFRRQAYRACPIHIRCAELSHYLFNHKDSASNV